ncbi:hypothetical protein HD806DRAFT_151547 [Xylariaceae sp. AK1471]|nr:hypothetical protein HD806DRAFT_151547 [Xylariaceae sp. AK1471]
MDGSRRHRWVSVHRLESTVFRRTARRIRWRGLRPIYFPLLAWRSAGIRAENSEMEGESPLRALGIGNLLEACGRERRSCCPATPLLPSITVPHSSPRYQGEYRYESLLAPIKMWLHLQVCLRHRSCKSSPTRLCASGRPTIYAFGLLFRPFHRAFAAVGASLKW